MKMDKHIEDMLFAQVGEEVAQKEYHPGPLARAVAVAKGDKAIVESLYIEYRVEELARQHALAQRNKPPAAKLKKIEKGEAVYKCPHCRKMCASDPSESGMEIRCPCCNRAFIVPVF